MHYPTLLIFKRTKYKHKFRTNFQEERIEIQVEIDYNPRNTENNRLGL